MRKMAWYTASSDGAKITSDSIVNITATQTLYNHAGNSELEGTKAPTCTEDGSTGTGTCTACGEKLSKSEVIPMLGHAMDDGAVTTEPTCEEKGVKTFRCTREGCDHQET